MNKRKLPYSPARAEALPALKSKPKRLQPVEEKIREKFSQENNFFFSHGEFPEAFQERLAPVLASQCLTLELGCASPPL